MSLASEAIEAITDVILEGGNKVTYEFKGSAEAAVAGAINQFGFDILNDIEDSEEQFLPGNKVMTTVTFGSSKIADKFRKKIKALKITDLVEAEDNLGQDLEKMADQLKDMADETQDYIDMYKDQGVGRSLSKVVKDMSTAHKGLLDAVKSFKKGEL